MRDNVLNLLERRNETRDILVHGERAEGDDVWPAASGVVGGSCGRIRILQVPPRRLMRHAHLFRRHPQFMNESAARELRHCDDMIGTSDAALDEKFENSAAMRRAPSFVAQEIQVVNRDNL